MFQKNLARISFINLLFTVKPKKITFKGTK